jgi:hypothetical protein
MGVGIPMTNNSFGFGTRIYAKISSVGTLLGNAVFFYDNDYGADLGYGSGLVRFLRAGDRVRIGPSTHLGYEGAYEDYKLIGVSGTTLSVDAGATVIFNLADPIVGVGTNCPGGWIPFAGGTLNMGGITSHDLVNLPTSPGYLDRHSAQFSGSGAGDNGLQWNFSLDNYEPSTYYRVGYWYQMTTTAGSGYFASILNANSTLFGGSSTTTDASTWTELNGAVSSLSPSTAGSAFYCRIYITNTSGGGTVTVNIDHFYVEHASQTDDETSGVYTFDDYPQLGSRQFRILGPSKYFRLANKRLVRNAVGSDTHKRYFVSASFKDVSTTLRDNLEVFVDWQDLGKPLVLHHDIPSVPPNLYGIMTIKDVSMGHWSGGVCSFSIEFEEM